MIRFGISLLSIIIPVLAYFININVGFFLSMSIIIMLQSYVVNITEKTNLYKGLSESYEKFIIKYFKRKLKEELK